MSAGPPDAVVIAFIDRWLADVAAGERQPVTHYEKLFPGFEDAIRAEYARVESPEVAPDAEQAATREDWIGHYRIVRLIGEGGQGSVYEALDARLGRRAALKVLRHLESPDALKRFHREASLLASFDHPRLCTLYEAGQHDGRAFIAMRFVEGRSLAALIRDQRGSGAGPIEIPRRRAREPPRRDERGLAPDRGSRPRSRLRAREGRDPPRRQAREHRARRSRRADRARLRPCARPRLAAAAR